MMEIALSTVFSSAPFLPMFFPPSTFWSFVSSRVENLHSHFDRLSIPASTDAYESVDSIASFRNVLGKRGSFDKLHEARG